MASSSVRSGSSASAPATGASIASVPCTTCRKRRVKCDKRLPGCTRCEKSGQPCPGYNRLRSFLDQGEALRQKYSDPSPRAKARHEDRPPGSEPDSSFKIRVGSREPSGPSPVPMPSMPFLPASQQTAKPTTSATGHFVPSDLGPIPSGTGTQQDTLSSYMSLDTLSDDEFNATFFDIDPNIYFAEGNNCCGWIPNAPLLNDLPDSQAPTISWLNQITPGNFSDASPYAETSMASIINTDSPALNSNGDDEYETAHLIQHFSEHISPYLDVFDIEKYFGHVVPVRARRSNLLSSSLAAIAAKQFAKTKKELHPGHSAATTPSTSFLDQYYTDPNVDWFYKAASFYDKAICQMMSSLQSLRDGSVDSGPDHDSGLDTSSPPFSDDMTGLDGNGASKSKRQRTERARTPANILDDLLAAVSIFLLYESLDNRQLEINQHMSGAHHLLMENLPDPAALPKDPRISSPLRSFDTVQAWQASFWNVVRIDYVVSYVERGHPRLNTTDQHLWQAAGLPLRDVNGLKLPESLCTGKGRSYSPHAAPMTETAACRTLLWIVLKALAFAAEQRDQSRTMEFMPQTQAVAATHSQRSIIESNTWQAIRDHLQAWKTLLPDSFEPYLRLPPQRPSQAQTPSRSDISGPGGESAIAIQFPTLQYSSAMASTAMVLYHFIQIYLLLHRPLKPSNEETFSRFASQRLGAYRQVSREVDDHASRICGICLGRPDDAVRMHMTQPLHLAGLSLENNEQRVVLEGLLSGIRRGTGCSTEWIVTSLREEWGWHDVP